MTDLKWINKYIDRYIVAVFSGLALVATIDIMRSTGPYWLKFLVIIGFVIFIFVLMLIAVKINKIKLRARKKARR